MEPAGSTFFYSLALFVVLAPLYKAGNRPLPLLLLELAAVGFVVALAVRGELGSSLRGLPRPLLAAIGTLLAYPLLQLLPLPDSVWRALPGHAPYAAVLEQYAATGVAGVHRAISVVPSATEYGWLALLPPLACLVAVQRLEPAQVVRLLLVLAIVAGVEGLLGLLQVAAGDESIFYLRNDQAFGTATGTFVNRNHFAAMLAMMLPVIVGLLVYSIVRTRHRHRGRGFAFDAEAVSQRALVFASAVLVLLCLLFTRSRAGIATALLGLAFSSVLLVRARAGWKHANLLVAGVVVTGVVLVALIGLAPILERVEPDQLRLSAEGRLAISAATLRAAIEFLPFGSGLSTFASVFPRFQVEAFGGYIDYAHNDYMQSFMELGLAAPVVVGLLLFTWASRMTALLRREGGRSFTVLQVAAGIALLPMIVHSLFDFGLHMPANAMWFATLAGVMLHPGLDGVRVHRERRTEAAEPSAPLASDAGGRSVAP